MKYAELIAIANKLHASGEKELVEKGWRAVKHGSTVLVLPHVETARQELKKSWYHSLIILAVPKPEDQKKFSDAVDSTDAGGPGYSARGAIGRFTASAYRPKGKKNARNNGVFLSYIQSHYRKGDGKGQIPPKLARKYANWRVRMLQEAITFSHDLGLPFTLHHKGDMMSNAFLENKRPDDPKSPFSKELEWAAKRANARVARSKSMVRVLPKRK